jgi:glycosyltransferase involved in cell wall biosynthesis
MRRSLLARLGPLDERFGAGMFEDDDFARRVRAAGGRVVCAEDVFVHHWGRASFGALPEGRYQEVFEENRRRFEQKWGEPWRGHRSRPDAEGGVTPVGGYPSRPGVELAPEPERSARPDTGEGQLVARLTEERDAALDRARELQAALVAIHGSRMWRWWTAYHAVRRAVLGPISRRLRPRPALEIGSVLRRALGAVYLFGWAFCVWLKMLWRGIRPAARVTEEPAPSRPFSRPPRILIVSPYQLLPLDHGGGVRIYNLVRRLARECEIHLLVFTPGGEDPLQREALAPLVKQLYFHHWRPELRPDRWRLAPGGAQLFDSPEVHERLRQIIAEADIDILQLEYTEMGQYRRSARDGVKVVLTEIDITFRARARRRRVGMHRRYQLDRIHGYSLVDWLRQLRYELTLVRRTDQVHVMSAADGAYLARFLPDGWRRLRVVPNAVDVDYYRLVPRDQRRARRLLFLGNFQHLPNLDAVDFLLDDIWPRVRARVPEAELWLVGARVPEGVARRDGRHGVSVVDTVPDTRPYYQGCRALVAPIRAGSGTRLKIVEAMACGTPVISTTIGAEGIDGVDGEHFLLADGAREFADAMCRLLADDQLCTRLGNAARQLVEARYTWEGSTAAALGGYRLLLENGPPASG